MSKEPKMAFDVYLNEKRKAIASSQQLRLPDLGDALQAVHWASFGQSAKSAVAALIRSCMLDPNTHAVGSWLKEWSRSDKVFAYLVEVRNAEIHAEDRDEVIPNPVSLPKLRIGGNNVLIEGGGTVHFHNSYIDGVPIDGTFGLENGLPRIETQSKVPVDYYPRQIRLNTVRDKKGNLHDFPFADVPAGVLPQVYAADRVLAVLEEKENEIAQARV